MVIRFKDTYEENIMTINEMEINKVLWCNDCGLAVLESKDGNCSNCGKPMTDIGFVEDKAGYKGIGGSVKQGSCACGRPRASKGIDEHGRTRYRTQCYKCLYAARKIVKATKCKICGIKPENKGDLHKDHIDGSNNSINNIQTLCAECHKYKTKRQQDWKKKNGK